MSVRFRPELQTFEERVTPSALSVTTKQHFLTCDMGVLLPPPSSPPPVSPPVAGTSPVSPPPPPTNPPITGGM